MRTSALFAGLALALAASACNAYDEQTFSASLAGANEVPATTETATGTFNLTFKGPVAEWELAVAGSGIANVTAAHIHQGAAGAAPASNIEVYLYDGPVAGSPNPTITTLRGSFISDQVTACTNGCLPTASRSFDGIRNDALASTAYVNVHTTTNTGGAIRGQIHP